MNRFALPAALIAAAALSACSHDSNGFPGGDPKRTVDATDYTVTKTVTATEYSVPNQLLFSTDSAEVLPTGHKILAEIADVAKHTGNAPIEVDGFTDTVGPKRYNKKLSVARAESVASELTSQGVDAARIKAQGFGETELAVPTPDQTDEAKNRRVVVRIAAR